MELFILFFKITCDKIQKKENCIMKFQLCFIIIFFILVFLFSTVSYGQLSKILFNFNLEPATIYANPNLTDYGVVLNNNEWEISAHFNNDLNQYLLAEVPIYDIDISNYEAISIDISADTSEYHYLIIEIDQNQYFKYYRHFIRLDGRFQGNFHRVYLPLRYFTKSMPNGNHAYPLNNKIDHIQYIRIYYDDMDTKIDNSTTRLYLKNLLAHKSCKHFHTRSQIFYFIWYGFPDSSIHWETNSDTIASDYYPSRGEYCSHNANIIEEHLDEIKNAGLGTLIVSIQKHMIWPSSDQSSHYLNNVIDIIFDEAAERDMKVTFLMDHGGTQNCFQSPTEIMTGWEILYQRYSSHDALYRSPINGRPTVYIWAAAGFSVKSYNYSSRYNNIINPNEVPPQLGWSHLDWQANFDAHNIDKISHANFLMQCTNLNYLDVFDGFFSFGYWDSDLEFFNFYYDFTNKIWAPASTPGFCKQTWDCVYSEINPAPYQDRLDGDLFIESFNMYVIDETDNLGIIQTLPNSFINVATYNEWHEGSQIESAFSSPFIDKPRDVSNCNNVDQNYHYRYREYHNGPNTYISISSSLFNNPMFQNLF